MNIYQFLSDHHIPYERHDHPAVYTVEESRRLVPPLPGAKTKNLFLRDRKGRRHILVTVGHEKNVDLKTLADLLGIGKLSFASSDRLFRFLGVDPGAVTMLAVVNDRRHAVEVVMDEPIWHATAVQCHPLVNTSTLVIPQEHLQRFFEITGHLVQVIDVPVRRV